MSIESEAYAKHMNLAKAAEDLNMNWKTLYCRLKKQGVKVVGDKLRYGTDRDKLGALGEKLFCELVPFSKNMNNSEFQSKYDFDVHGFKVDVKTGKPRKLSKKFNAESWAFSFKKQSLVCDFIVCFCLDESSNIELILIVPSEFFKGLQTVSVSRVGHSKWKDYSTSKEDLPTFFNDLVN